MFRGSRAEGPSGSCWKSRTMWVRAQASESKLPGLKPCLIMCQLCAWANCFAPPGLHFFFYEVGMVLLTPPCDCEGLRKVTPVRVTVLDGSSEHCGWLLSVEPCEGASGLNPGFQTKCHYPYLTSEAVRSQGVSISTAQWTFYSGGNVLRA